MADEYNKLNAELRKVEDDLFAVDDFSAKEPVPLDAAMKPVAEEENELKPLPVEEDLTPATEGFVPVAEEHETVAVSAVEEAPLPEIRTFSEERPFHQEAVPEQPEKQPEVPAATSPLPPPEEAPEREIVPPQTVAVRDADKLSLGTILRDARSSAGLTPDQAADVTRIRQDYIIGIENDDFKHLPPVVFIRAYVRTLGILYRLDQPTMDAVIRKVNELNAPADVPEQILQKLEKTAQINEEETKRLKRMLLYAGLAVALILSLTITGIVAAVVSRSGRTDAQTAQLPAQTESGPAFRSSDLEKLMPQQVPEIQVLSVPGAGQK